MWSFCGWWGVGCSFYIRFLETRILYNMYRICYRTLLNINNSGFNQLVRTKSLESVIINFGIPSFKPCPSPCQLTENSERLMECSFGNVSDQVCRQNGIVSKWNWTSKVLLHILTANSLPWWFFLFPAWIGVIFVLVLSNVLSYVFNQRLRLRLSLPPTPGQVLVVPSLNEFHKRNYDVTRTLHSAGRLCKNQRGLELPSRPCGSSSRSSTSKAITNHQSSTS